MALTVRSFRFKDFLDKIKKRGGDVQEVHYTFGGTQSIRQVTNYRNGVLAAKMLDTEELMSVRSGFHTDKFNVVMSEYPMPPKKGSLRKRKGVLIRIKT